jgi:hypothetical protein
MPPGPLAMAVTPVSPAWIWPKIVAMTLPAPLLIMLSALPSSLVMKPVPL